MWFKEKDMVNKRKGYVNKMSGAAKFCKSNERGIRDCDECWKGRSEVQSTWEKKYILKYKLAGSIYTSIMKFRYIEDYKKMKKLNEKLYEIVKKMDYRNQPYFKFMRKREFIEELFRETKDLEEFVKKMLFL